MSEDTAWPRSPVAGALLALLGSLVLGGLYCWATVLLLPAPQRAVFRVYSSAAIRSAVPMPHFGRTRQPSLHTFTFQNGSSITTTPTALYQSMRKSTYGGHSLLRLFRNAGIAWIITLLILMGIVARSDRRKLQELRDGRRLRGPQIYTISEYNRKQRGNGVQIEAEDA